MNTCFVIQPFDDEGPFDKRFDQVLVPAIKGTQLEPYRVDRDPRVSIPIDEIENAIRGSAICLADITEDNPNVWFELGYAIAARKDVVLICSALRQTKFPFDVQHRTIITYSVESPGDFETLRKKVTERIKAVLDKGESLAIVAASPLAEVEGLSQHELITLASLVENLARPDGAVYPSSIHQDVARNGFTQMASVLGIKGLTEKDVISETTIYDEAGENYLGYMVTENGWNWIRRNEDKFNLRRPAPASDDIPF